MHPIIILAAVGAGLLLGKKLASVGAEMRKAGGARKGGASAKKQADKNKAESLKQDPVTGVYKVDD